VLIGIKHDPAFGPVLVVGWDGVLTELIDDSATLLLPTSASEICHALGGLKVGALLHGYRGGPVGAGFNEGWAAYERSDYATALEELLPPANEGNAWAQFYLGTMYGSGNGVPQDYSKAAKWLRLAAFKQPKTNIQPGPGFGG
jgi:hypothetical protein